MTLAEWLKAEKQSQSGFAQTLGVPRQTVQAWATGGRRPTLYYALVVQMLTDDAVPVTEWLTAQERHALRGMRS